MRIYAKIYYWSNNGYRAKYYLDKLVIKKENGLIKVITGNI